MNSFLSTEFDTSENSLQVEQPSCSGTCCHCGLTAVKMKENNKLLEEVSEWKITPELLKQLNTKNRMIYFGTNTKNSEGHHMIIVIDENGLGEIHQSWVHCYPLSWWEASCRDNKCYNSKKCNTFISTIDKARAQYGMRKKFPLDMFFRDLFDLIKSGKRRTEVITEMDWSPTAKRIVPYQIKKTFFLYKSSLSVITLNNFFIKYAGVPLTKQSSARVTFVLELFER
jgi:hypothetical protein